MRTEEFISKLEGVRQTRKGGWLARCPAHEDRSPSLSVSEGDDGRILLNCFGGCSAHEVVRSVGLEMDALFPDRLPGTEYVKGLRRPFPAADVLAALADEALLVAVAAYNQAHGIELDDRDRERLLAAYGRIAAGRRLALGER